MKARKTIIRIFKNKRNPHKRLEIHNDGHYHNSVKSYMEWDNGVKNLLGNKKLNRWKKANLVELLEDYEEVKVV